MPHDASSAWADLHLSAQRRRVGDDEPPAAPAPSVAGAEGVCEPALPRADGGTSRPEPTVAAGLHRPAGADEDGRKKTPARRDEATQSRTGAQSRGPAPSHRSLSDTALAGRKPAQTTIDDMLAGDAGKAGPDVHVRPAPPPPAASPVRRLVGNPLAGEDAQSAAPGATAGGLPAALRELAFIDRVNEVGAQLDVVDKPTPLARLYDQDLAILKLLDRNGITLPALIAFAAMPGRSDSQVRRTLSKLHRHGLVGRRRIGIRAREEYRGQLPYAYELTRLGFDTAQARGAIPERREYRPQQVASGARLPHDHHALAWAIALHRLVGDLATDNWRTPRYATGRFAVPHTGGGHKRRPIGPSDIELDPSHALFDVAGEDFNEIKPDVCCELHERSLRLRFDLLVEFHHHANLPSTEQKFRHYDAFLTGWCLQHPRYRQLATRPVVVVVAAEPKELLALARKADQAMKGAIGVQGTAAQDWYYAGRDHVLFALEEDLHRQHLGSLALPALPPDLRARLGSEGLELRRVALLPSASGSVGDQPR